MEKVVYFAFKGETMCFIHVLINVLDMNSKGMEAKIVFEGESVMLVKELEENRNPLYLKAKEGGMIDSICKACSFKMGVLEYNSKVGIPFSDEMNGHPSMASYVAQGYRIITL